MSQFLHLLLSRTLKSFMVTLFLRTREGFTRLIETFWKNNVFDWHIPCSQKNHIYWPFPFCLFGAVSQSYVLLSPGCSPPFTEDKTCNSHIVPLSWQATENSGLALTRTSDQELIGYRWVCEVKRQFPGFWLDKLVTSGWPESRAPSGDVISSVIWGLALLTWTESLLQMGTLQPHLTYWIRIWVLTRSQIIQMCIRISEALISRPLTVYKSDWILDCGAF